MVGYVLYGRPAVPLNGDAAKRGELTFVDRIPVFPGYDAEFDNQGVRLAQSSRLAALWRRRDMPDPALADTVYAGTAPTISTTNTTTPQAGFVKYAPPGVALGTTTTTGGAITADETAPFTYLGAGDFRIGTVAPDPSYVIPVSKYPNMYAAGQGTWSLEWLTDAQVFQARMKWISASTMYRLSIDGRKVTDLMQSSGGTAVGGGHLITFDLGSAAWRRIRLDLSNLPFGGIYLPGAATMAGVPARGGRWMILGDSISDGSANNTGAACGTWVDRAARLLGVTDVWRQGRGGTGYITDGSFARFQTRLALDVLPYKPDRLVVWGGYNDSGADQGAIRTAADLLYATIKGALPNCQIIVVGCWSPTAVAGAGQVATTATLKAAAAAAKLHFISPQDGKVYGPDGVEIASHGAWVNAHNAASIISADGVHPNDAGHVYLGRRLAAAIAETMPA